MVKKRVHVPEGEQASGGWPRGCRRGTPGGGSRAGPEEKKYQRRASAPRESKMSNGAMTLPRGLGHLLAVLVDDEGQADHVAVRGGAEDERVDRQQRVEPAAGLVDGLADEVGREGGGRRRSVGAVGERVVVLGRGHGPRVEPGVEHRGHPGHRCRRTVGGAGEGDVVDVGPVQVELGEVAPGELRQLGDRADAVLVAGGVAAPDGQRGAPVAVTGEGPVDVALEPLAEAAVLDEARGASRCARSRAGARRRCSDVRTNHEVLAQ